MGDTRKIVRPGAKVTIEVAPREAARLEAEEAPARAEEAPQAPLASAGLLYATPTLPGDVVRPQDTPGITFYDLGTRLRSVSNPDNSGLGRFDNPRQGADADNGLTNEYVEIPLDFGEDLIQLGDFGEYLPILTAQRNAEATARLLGTDWELDPLGFSIANESGRVIPNSLPIPHDYPELFAVHVNGRLYRLGKRSELPPALIPDGEVFNSPNEWRPRERETGEGAERWNTFNLADNVPFGQGILDPEDMEAGGGIAIVNPAYAIESQTLVKPEGSNLETPIPYSIPQGYEVFDTADAVNFKITATPEYEAEEVEFTFDPETSVRVYLRPRPIWVYPGATVLVNTPEGPGFGGQTWPGVIGRFPVYPRIPRYRQWFTYDWIRHDSEEIAELEKDLIELETRTIRAYITRSAYVPDQFEHQTDLLEAQNGAVGWSVTRPYSYARIGFSDITEHKRYNGDTAEDDVASLYPAEGLLCGVIATGTGAREEIYYIWKRNRERMVRYMEAGAEARVGTVETENFYAGINLPALFMTGIPGFDFEGGDGGDGGGGGQD